MEKKDCCRREAWLIGQLIAPRESISASTALLAFPGSLDWYIACFCLGRSHNCFGSCGWIAQIVMSRSVDAALERLLPDSSFTRAGRSA